MIIQLSKDAWDVLKNDPHPKALLAIGLPAIEKRSRSYFCYFLQWII